MEQFVSVSQPAPVTGVFPVRYAVEVVIEHPVDPGVTPGFAGVGQDVFRAEARGDGLAIDSSTSYSQIISHTNTDSVANKPFRHPHGGVLLERLYNYISLPYIHFIIPF